MHVCMHAKCILVHACMQLNAYNAHQCMHAVQVSACTACMHACMNACMQCLSVYIPTGFFLRVWMHVYALAAYELLI